MQAALSTPSSGDRRARLGPPTLPPWSHHVAPQLLSLVGIAASGWGFADVGTRGELVHHDLMFFQIVIVFSFHECRVPRVGLRTMGLRRLIWLKNIAPLGRCGLRWARVSAAALGPLQARGCRFWWSQTTGFLLPGRALLDGEGRRKLSRHGRRASSGQWLRRRHREHPSGHRAEPLQRSSSRQ